MIKQMQFVMGGVAAVCLVAGCSSLTPPLLTVGPDYERPATDFAVTNAPDAGWASTNITKTGEYAPEKATQDPRVEITHARLQSWWNSFNDPVLTNLVASAISNNLNYAIVRHRLTQARWTYARSGSSLFPQLGLSGDWTRSESHRNNSVSQLATYEAGGSRAAHNDTFRSGFDASWEIDLFGGTRREIEAAGALFDAAEFSVADAWVSLTSEIAGQYIALRTVQQRLVVARTNLKLQKETYDILKSRLDSGIGDELAVNQSRYVVEQTRAGIPDLLAAEEKLMNAIAVLAGTMPGALHDVLKECPNRDWLVVPQRLSQIPVNAMRERPDVRVAERRLAAQVASVGVAVSYLYPKFYINGTLGLQSVKIQKFLSPGSLYSSIGPSFSWPIFQGGNTIANIHLEEAKMDEALCAYEAALQNAYCEARDAYAAYTQEYNKYKSLKAAVKAAKDAETISKDLYKNGLADFNNVLDAQRSLLTYEESLTVSRGQISQKLIALYKALGGGLAF